MVFVFFALMEYGIMLHIIAARLDKALRKVDATANKTETSQVSESDEAAARPRVSVSSVKQRHSIYMVDRW